MIDNPRLSAIADREAEIRKKLKSGDYTYRKLHEEMKGDLRVSYETFCRYIRKMIKFNRKAVHVKNAKRDKTKPEPISTPNPTETPVADTEWEKEDLSKYYK